MNTAIGIDIGGTGIKGAVVDLTSGSLITDRLKTATPDGGHPSDIIAVTVEMVERLEVEVPGAPVGLCLPSVVRDGVTCTAANVDDEWVGFPAEERFALALGRSVHLINDADAAGIAEARYGAARGCRGLAIVTTLGTGIGTAFIYDGVLIPNVELGHLEIDGVRWETVASNAAREREHLDWAEWAERLQRFYGSLERYFNPDLFVIGGGVSKQHDQFLPRLRLHTPVVPASLLNNAGIMGAATLARPHGI